MLDLGIVVGREQERIALVSKKICQLVSDAKTDDPCGDFRVLYICNMYIHEKLYIYTYIYSNRCRLLRYNRDVQHFNSNHLSTQV